MVPFSIVFHHATPHGVIAAVHIPDSPDPVPAEVLDSLLPAEAHVARTLRGYRQVQFTGGRLAMHEACSQLGIRPLPVLIDELGAPITPPGVVGSLTHKRTLALAMAARDDHGTLGVDLEEYGPPRPGIAARVLTPDEREAVDALPPERQWIAVLLRFSIKEAIYKALNPYLRRYVGFHEAAVKPDVRGHADVTLRLAEGEGPFRVSARYEWLHGRILTSVRIYQERAD